MSKLFFSSITAIAFSGLIGCLDKPKRDNPLDPDAINFQNNNTVSGQIITFYMPHEAISDVQIRMEPGSLVTKTNNEGQFRFENVPANKYMISASKEGYAAESIDSIAVEAGEIVQIPSIKMDSLPIINSFSIISCHISRWFPRDALFRLEIDAQLEDFDGINDIDLVEFVIPQLSFIDTLVSTPTSGVFLKRINQSEFPSQNLQDIIGLQAFLKVRDRAGFQNISAPNFLARIIEQTPTTKSPQSLQQLNDPRPYLIWHPISLSFDFTYHVEVVRDDSGISNVVWTQPNISIADTSITVADSLTTGTYYWTIAVFDKFGNWSRSKEASFIIN